MKPQILIQLGLCLAAASVASAIVGGQETNPNEYPWNIILYRNGSFYCTGTIISPWSVLTAADCVQPDPQQRPLLFTVIAGEWDITVDEGTEQTRNVTDIIRHPRFNDCGEHNIAILVLEYPLVYDARVHPVPALSDRFFDDEAIASSNCAVSGWGVISMDSYLLSTNPDKKHALVPTNVVTNKDCNRALGVTYTATRNMICTVNNNAATCYGDSGTPLYYIQGDSGSPLYYFQGDGGAPLVCPDSDGVYHLVGLEFKQPIYDCYFGVTVFTRISPHRKWIEDNKV